ncbi:MAG: ArnT family glycosyltransferase [Microgenomates group bacterium]
MSKKEKIFLILIFILAFGVRIWDIGNHPTFISDEASIGYNAWSILKTGKDEWGIFLPLNFKAFGEYKLPVYIYTATPFLGIFGLNETAVRLPSVIFGVLSVLIVIFLAKEIIKETSIFPFLTGFFLAILPWHIQTSRMALEANLAFFLLILGTLFFFKGIKNNKFFYFSFLIFALSLYTYNACRIFTPLLLGGMIFFFISRQWQKIIPPLLLMILFSFPLVLSGFRGTPERLAKVGIFTNQGILAQINEKRGICLEKNPEFFCRLFYNRPVFYSLIFFKNYFSHFSLDFLFLKGPNLAQYTVPQRGMAYLWQLPLIILGIFWFLKKERKIFLFLVWWLLVSPIANSFTGTAHPVRAIFLLLLIPFLNAGGATMIWENIRNKKIKTVFLGGILFFSFISWKNFLFDYFFSYPKVHTSTWQAGYKPLYQKLSLLEKDYERILVTKFYGEPHIFYLFYQKYDPKLYQEEKEVIRYDREDKWVNVDRIGKYWFIDDWRKIKLKTGELITISPQEINFEIELLEEIKYQDGKTAFLIGKIK